MAQLCSEDLERRHQRISAVTQ